MPTMRESHTPITADGASDGASDGAFDGASNGASGERRADVRIHGAQLGALLDALVSGGCLAGTVPLVLQVVERDPLASGGRFAGDLVRALAEVPGSFWSRHPGLYTRYRTVLRANAAARKALPIEERMQFWAPLADRRDDVPPDPTPRTRLA
jgi:hypothetical protein